MKIIYSFIAIYIFALLLISCGDTEEKQKQKSKDLITARTLGLAYLEENSLEKAEIEFKKLIKLAPKEKIGYANLGLVYLRMGKYTEAEKILKKAIKIDSKDPDIKLILSKVYEMDDKKELAVSTLIKSLQFDSTHVKTLYNLSELYSTKNDDVSKNERKKCILKIIENDRDNIVPRLNLIEILIRDGDSDKALEQLEEIVQLFPQFPREAIEHYNNTITSLQLADNNMAITSFIIFHNYLKVTPPYQAGIVDLKGPGGSLIGFPVITFDKNVLTRDLKPETILDAIKFVDVTSSAGLDVVKKSEVNLGLNSEIITHISVCDYDDDGDVDLYVGNYDSETATYSRYLFKNEMGKFIDVTKEAGIRHTGNEIASKFDDYDNDGFFDLFIILEDKCILYKNNGKGGFNDVTKKANLGGIEGGNKALFFDYDHEGDLDLFIAKKNKNALYQNNGDGTFTEQAGKAGVAGEEFVSRDAVFGDFDEDGDIDLIVTNENSIINFYSNQRQGVFKDIINKSGLEDVRNSDVVAVGDYNNDGFLDLFLGSSKGGNHELYMNTGDGKFTKDNKSTEIFNDLKKVNVYDASFFDFDNDGALDLLIVGESTEKDGKGVFLFHNNGIDKFDDISYILPDDLKSGRQIATFDYNVDGDIDIIITGINGGIRLLRNDGGNLNHFVKIKLVGLRTGSAKNNYYGIGAKVEMRSGELYQTKVVTDPNVHFGLGNRQKSDVIRITWTNGVPQNIFFPGTDQGIIEKQVLKGSCPFLYTWNGKEYIFVKDILWRSALGMPVGIMSSGRTSYAFSDASDDYYLVPGEMLKSENGIYSIQVTSELWETIYLDKIRLIAVDHPETVDIYVDEQFSPPPFPEYRIYTVENKQLPLSATDGNGTNLLSLISEKDDKYISNFKLDKYQGITEMKELILDLGKNIDRENLYLFLNGWVFPTDASINYALTQSEVIKVGSPVVQVINNKGEWVTVINNLGFPMGKDKTVIADLSGKFLSNDTRVRILTNMQIYWDHIFYSSCNPDARIISNELAPASADLHYRGFSEEYRKGGRYGPHWFDYSKVSKETKWRDLTGYYTRYGDVLPLLNEADDKYIISNAGDELTIRFNETELPELKKGWKRDFVIYNVGWVKDGDMNTAFGNTVEPLPFHGMTCYPYGENESYPSSEEHQNYQKEYNTRKVTTEGYINALK